MPAIRIPQQQGNWTGQYQGDYYGDIRRSFNVDLERNPGKIELSQVQQIVFTDTNDTDFQRVEAFAKTNLPGDSSIRFYAAAFDTFDGNTSGYRLFHSTDSNPDTGWVHDSDESPINTQYFIHDIINFPDPNIPKDRLVATGDTSVLIKSHIFEPLQVFITSHSNDSDLNDLDSDVFHPLDVFEGNLLIANKNEITSVNNSDSEITDIRVSIPADYYIHHMFHTRSIEWLLGSNSRLEGVISEWDGFSFIPTRNYFITEIPLTGVDYYGIPIILTSKGTFLTFTGNSFTILKDNFGKALALPVANESGNSLLNSEAWPLVPSTFGVARRGMAVDGEVIKINVGKSKTETFGEFKQNSGIWVLDPINKTLYNSGSKNGYVSESGALFVDGEGLKLASVKEYENFNGTERHVIKLFKDIDDSTIQRGFFETQWINIPQPEATWETLWIKHKKLNDTNCKIIAKARIEEGPFFTSEFFTDTNVHKKNLAQILTTGDSSFQARLSGDSLVVGDEMEILSGVNSGRLYHINTISGNDTQIFTVDEPHDTGTGYFAATFGRWKKLQLPNGDSSITYGDSLVIHNFVIPAEIKNSPKISFKIVMQGRAKDISIEELALQWEVNKETKR